MRSSWVEAPADSEGEDVAPPVPPDVMIPRSYQLALLEQAKKENAIVYLETGSGKTHIAVMLLQHIADVIRKPSSRFAVFLCPNVALVQQQANVVKENTDLKVGTYFGEMNIDAWKSETWEAELEKSEVFVMTPAILLQNLHHCFMRMDCIELLIFDECHHADKRHPYACIMQEFYHPRSKDVSYKLPRILGMTASPFHGKVDRQGQRIEKELDKIERMLHAKLHTVKEGSDFAPRPLAEFIYYESTAMTNPATEEFARSLLHLKNECLKNLLGASRCEDEVLGDPYTNAERKTFKNIEKLYNSLQYCGSELGIRCAYDAVKVLLNKYDRDCDSELDVKSESKEAFLHNTLTLLKSLESQGGVPHFSPKVRTLIDILERYRDTKDMRCIIFVERKIATRALASLLTGIKSLSSVFRFQSLTGKGAGLNVMNLKAQQDVVESFRDGKVNVLVSTNVAEEGLDIQSCHLVIRFDLPKTPCSFIQSRGRARCLKSAIVYLVQRDNNEHLERLEQFKSNEESMKEQVLGRIETFDDVSAPEITTIETFEVESTGAKISTLCSVSLLHQYCARLAHDSFFTPMPEFSYSEGSWGVRCTVRLPTDALVQIVEGRPVPSQNDAKRVACLDACKRLYEAGALTDFLLLKPEEEECLLDAFVPDLDVVPEKSPSPTHSPSIPDAFSGTWARGLDRVVLHAYALSFEANPKDRVYVNFGLFLEADLGPEAGAMEVKLQLSNRRLMLAKCSPSGTIAFDPDQLRNAKQFQETVFSAVLDHKPGIENSGAWNPDRLYLLLPLTEKQESSYLSIDWDSVENVISDVEYITLDSVPPEIPGSSLVKLYDGYVPVSQVTNSLVQTMYNTKVKEWLYCARELIPNLTAESPMAMKDPKDSSYLKYFERQHETKLKHSHQLMLEAKRLKKVRNLLIKVDPPATEELSGAVEQLVELPLEQCRIRVKGLSNPLTNSISLLPSFMHHLEGLLLALQLRRALPLSHRRASPVPAHLMLEAITTSKCGETFNLEGLELLGDAFLEVSVSERLFLVHSRMQEGHLSKKRTARICNLTLERLGRERGLTNYIRDSQFSPEDWAAPGRTHEFCAESIEAEDVDALSRSVPKQTRRTGTPLQGKTIADVFEALIGAHYIHGGVDAAQAMMGWLGCEVGVDFSIKEEARTRVHGQLSLLPESKVAELEKLLNYKFENKGLLVEALTHASCLRRAGDCYQRLEFLGDAVLDFLITRHLYENSVVLRREPGLLTDLRSAAVNNECFARVAVRHSLHLYVLHNSRELAASVEKYVKFVHDSMTDAQCHGWKGDAGPKVLSDLVESLAGAVFLDCDYNLDRVWSVFEGLLKPLVTPETLRLEPTRELRELCQKQKLGDPKFNIEDGTRGRVLITVTVLVKGERIIGVGRKEDKRNAKKIAAIHALALLKELGYEHHLRRLVQRKALYATKFSDLVIVPEGGLQPLASVDEAIRALQSEGKDAGITRPACGGRTTSAVCEKACILDRNIIDKTAEAEIASRSMPSSSSVREDQSYRELDRKRQKGNSVQSNGGDFPTDQAFGYRNPGCSSEPGLNTSSPSPSRQTTPQVIENSEFGKLCRAYMTSSNANQNSFARDKVTTINKPQQGPLTRDLGVPTTRGSSTTTTFAVSSEAALTPEFWPPGARNEPSVPKDVSKQEPIASETTCAMTESVLSNLVHTELLGTSQVSGRGTSSDANCEMNGGTRRTLVSDDRMDIDTHTPGCRDQVHQTGTSASATFVAEYLHSLLNRSMPPPPSQPTPPLVTGLQMAKGEARSLLNALCMKHRWPDPMYTMVWKGGVSHAPLFRYMVQTRVFMGGQAFEVDVEGEMEKNVNGAKDSAAARLLMWCGEQGIPVV